jgi:flagellar hook assembly protein FlgD
MRHKQVVLSVYNNAGQLVKTLVDDYKAPGEYSVVWDSKDKSGKTVTSGSYFYQIRVGDFVSSKKMIVNK